MKRISMLFFCAMLSGFLFAAPKADLEKAINNSLRFWNRRTVDLSVLITPEELSGLEAFPKRLSVATGFSIPLKNGGLPPSFVGQISADWDGENFKELAAAAGLKFENSKPSRVFTEYSFLAGYGVNFKSAIRYGLIQPQAGLGFFLGENLKVTIVGSLRLSYCLESEEFSSNSYAGLKIGFGL